MYDASLILQRYQSGVNFIGWANLCRIHERMRLMTAVATMIAEAIGVIIEGEEMFYRVCTGYSKQFEGARLPIASTMAGSSVLRGEVMRTDDTERDPRANVAAARRLKVRSMLNVPLKRDNQTVGVLSIVSQVPFAFVDSDERTLELLAGLLGRRHGATPPSTRPSRRWLPSAPRRSPRSRRRRSSSPPS